MDTNRDTLKKARPIELHNETIHFEHSDINARGTFLTGVGVLVGIWIITGLLFFYFSFLRQHKADTSPPPLPADAHGNLMPPEPRLQNAPRQDLKAMRAREDWEMNHYYWVDRSKGKVAIPIEQAIKIIAARGIPPAKMPPNAALTPPQAGARTTGFEGKVEPEPR